MILRLVQSAQITTNQPAPAPSLRPPTHYACTTASTCTLICNSSNPCQNLHVNASLAPQLDLNCTAAYACSNLQVTVGNGCTSFNIYDPMTKSLLHLEHLKHDMLHQVYNLDSFLLHQILQ